eukprot:7667815-Ditylum_brightwellii.AAC.1
MKISCEEFVNVLEDRIPYRWKLEFNKEGSNLSFSMLKEFLDTCVHLKEAELQKPLRKTITCVKKEHDKDRKRKCQDKPKSHHERRHGLGKQHQEKRKKKYCNYHGSMFSPHTASQNSRGSDRSGLSRTLKGRPKSAA